MPLSASLLPEFDHEMANTRKSLERIPEDKFAWKPDPKSFSLGALASHIANMCEWATITLQTDSLDYMTAERPGEAATRAELLATFDKNLAAARAALTAATDQHLLAPWTLSGGGKPMFTMPRIAVLRSMIVNHIIHHRGQLTVYLRMNGAPVPALYGPSADES